MDRSDVDGVSADGAMPRSWSRPTAFSMRRGSVLDARAGAARDRYRTKLDQVTGAVLGDCSVREGATISASLGGPARRGLHDDGTERTDRAGLRVGQANPFLRRGAHPVPPR